MTIGTADDSRARHLRWLYAALILIGIGLRAWQFLADTSLNVDEIALARDVVRTSALNLLLHPLSQQIAPRGFLLASKAAVGLFGPTDMALRTVAFVSAIVSVIAFWRLAIRLRGWAGPLALALFGTTPPLLLFGAEVKQYSCDVLATVLLLLMAIRLARDETESVPRRTAYALTGAAAVWFSHAAVLVVAAQVAVLLWRWRGQRQMLVSAAPVLLAWIASAVAAAIVAAMSVDTQLVPYLKQYWATGFMPLPFPSMATLPWFADRIMSPLRGETLAGMGLPLPGFAVVLIALGFIALWRRERAFMACLLAPVVVALCAAAMQQYPFADRLMLFVLPIFCIALAVGIDAVRAIASAYSKAAAWLVYVSLAGAFLSPLFAVRPPYHMEDMKPVLEYLRARRQPDDRIYVYYAAAPAVMWYGGHYELAESTYAVGGCHRGYAQAYLRELDEFRGSPRFWVVIAHARADLGERENILTYLDGIGVLREQLAMAAHEPADHPTPAAAYLYDLSGAPALPTTPDGDAEQATPSCLYGPQVMVSKRGLR